MCPVLPAKIRLKHFCDYCIIGSMHSAGSLSVRAKTFLDFCRVEKGLAANTMEAYRRDLARCLAFFGERAGVPDTLELKRYIDSLYAAELSSRSIARHITTLRTFYQFLLREQVIDTDPTAFLTLPRQWSS